VAVGGGAGAVLLVALEPAPQAGRAAAA
jgi:hypothetical protein